MASIVEDYREENKPPQPSGGPTPNLGLLVCYQSSDSTIRLYDPDGGFFLIHCGSPFSAALLIKWIQENCGG